MNGGANNSNITVPDVRPLPDVRSRGLRSPVPTLPVDHHHNDLDRHRVPEDQWRHRMRRSSHPMKQVRLLGGRVVEVEDNKAARLVRKFGARYIEAAVRAPANRAVLPRAGR